MLWKLRYRGRLQVQETAIETFTDDEIEAKELADATLDRMENPNIRFVAIERMVGGQSQQFEALTAKWGPGGTEEVRRQRAAEEQLREEQEAEAAAAEERLMAGRPKPARTAAERLADEMAGPGEVVERPTRHVATPREREALPAKKTPPAPAARKATTQPARSSANQEPAPRHDRSDDPRGDARRRIAEATRTGRVGE